MKVEKPTMLQDNKNKSDKTVIFIISIRQKKYFTLDVIGFCNWILGSNPVVLIMNPILCFIASHSPLFNSPLLLLSPPTHHIPPLILHIHLLHSPILSPIKRSPTSFPPPYHLSSLKSHVWLLTLYVFNTSSPPNSALNPHSPSHL